MGSTWSDRCSGVPEDCRCAYCTRRPLPRSQNVLRERLLKVREQFHLVEVPKSGRREALDALSDAELADLLSGLSGERLRALALRFSPDEVRGFLAAVDLDRRVERSAPQKPTQKLVRGFLTAVDLDREVERSAPSKPSSAWLHLGTLCPPV